MFLWMRAWLPLGKLSSYGPMEPLFMAPPPRLFYGCASHVSVPPRMFSFSPPVVSSERLDTQLPLGSPVAHARRYSCSDVLSKLSGSYFLAPRD